MKSIVSAFAALLLVAGFGVSTASWGWGAQPIKNVEDAAIATTKPATKAQVKAAIVSAGVSLGWQMVEVSPGLIRGTLHLRKHTAVVDVPYTTTKYSIKYKSSVNLDAQDGNIHRNYNSWVQNLSNKIAAELSRQ